MNETDKFSKKRRFWQKTQNLGSRTYLERTWNVLGSYKERSKNNIGTYLKRTRVEMRTRCEPKNVNFEYQRIWPSRTVLHDMAKRKALELWLKRNTWVTSFLNKKKWNYYPNTKWNPGISTCKGSFVHIISGVQFDPRVGILSTNIFITTDRSI